MLYPGESYFSHSQYDLVACSSLWDMRSVQEEKEFSHLKILYEESGGEKWLVLTRETASLKTPRK